MPRERNETHKTYQHEKLWFGLNPIVYVHTHTYKCITNLFIDAASSASRVCESSSRKVEMPKNKTKNILVRMVRRPLRQAGFYLCVLEYALQPEDRDAFESNDIPSL